MICTKRKIAVVSLVLVLIMVSLSSGAEPPQAFLAAEINVLHPASGKPALPRGYWTVGEFIGTLSRGDWKQGEGETWVHAVREGERTLSFEFVRTYHSSYGHFVTIRRICTLLRGEQVHYSRGKQPRRDYRLAVGNQVTYLKSPWSRP